MRCATLDCASSSSVDSGSVGRAQHDEEDRLIGRVDLLVRRRRRHLRRQLPRRAADHRLHVLRGGIDVAAQVELQRDVGAALRARRVDARQPGDGRELLLERQRHRRGHRLRAGARQRRAARGWSGSRRSAGRRPAAADRPCTPNTRMPEHQQRGRDRPPDEDRREIHDATFASAAGSFWPSTLIRAPGTSRR